MPTIYGEDKVAQAVGDHALGQMGVRTGSVANGIGYADYEQRQRAARASSSSSVPLAPAGLSGPSYEPYAFIQVIEEHIPRWLLIGLGLLTASAFVIAGVRYDFFPALRVGGELNWGGLLVSVFLTACSYCLGAIVVPLVLRIFDVGLKLLVLALKIALFVGGVYLLIRLVEILT